MSLDRTGANIKGVHNTPGTRRPNAPKPESISRVVGPKHHYGTRTQSKLQTESNDPDASALLPGSPDGPPSPSVQGFPDQSPGFAQPSLTGTPAKKAKETTGTDGKATLPNNDSDNPGVGPDYNDQNSALTTPVNMSPVQGRLTRSATKRIAENEDNDDSHSMPDVQRSAKRKKAAREDWRDNQLPSPLTRSTNPGQAENGTEPSVFDDPPSPYITPATPRGPAEYSDEPPEYQSPSSPNIRPEAFQRVEGGYAYEDYTYVGEVGQDHMKFKLEVSVPMPPNLDRRTRGDWDREERL